MQKFVKIAMIALLAGFIATSCNQESDLPYPIKDVEEGVLVDISKKPNTDVFIDAIAPDAQPNLGVSLNLVPKGEGSWDKLDLVIIHQSGVDNTFRKFVYQENITSLPQSIDLDYDKILQGFGLERENPGDNFHVVIDIHLPNGLVVFGWTPYTGFTNTDFASWQYEGRGFSRKINYPAACPIDPDFWVGAAQSRDVEYDIIENSTLTALDENDVPPTSYFEGLGMTSGDINSLDLVGFLLEGFYLDSDGLTQQGDKSQLKFWINKTNFQLFIPNQSTGLHWNLGAALEEADQYYEIFVEDVINAQVNTCTGVISFIAYKMPIGESIYSFWEKEFEITVMAFADEEVKTTKNTRSYIDAIRKR